MSVPVNWNYSAPAPAFAFAPVLTPAPAPAPGSMRPSTTAPCPLAVAVSSRPWHFHKIKYLLGFCKSSSDTGVVLISVIVVVVHFGWASTGSVIVDVDAPA